jgi:hypothetical protein
MATVLPLNAPLPPDPPRIDFPLKRNPNTKGVCMYHVKTIAHRLQEPLPGYDWNYSRITEDVFSDLRTIAESMGLQAHLERDVYVYLLGKGNSNKRQRLPIVVSTAEIDRSQYRSFGILTIMGPCEVEDSIKALGHYIEKYFRYKDDYTKYAAAVRSAALTAAAGNAAARGSLGANLLLPQGARGVSSGVADLIESYTGEPFAHYNERIRRAGELGILGPAKLRQNKQALSEVPEVGPGLSKTCGPLGCSIMGGSRKIKKTKKTKKAKKSRVKNRHT